MPLRLRSGAFGADDPAAAAAFWAAMLGREVVEDTRGLLVPGDDTQLGLRFVPRHAERSGLNRMHVHLTSTSNEDQRATVATALDLGARHLDVGQRPEEGHVVLADPGGNEFCVIEPGNAFLAGCGRLGELACDGSRSTGVFWSDALAWPLVWDQDEETAVQAPAGGTKVAWGGPPLRPVDPSDPQHFDVVLSGGDLDAEVERLVALGASRRSAAGDVVVLVDPDRIEFRLSTS